MIYDYLTSFFISKTANKSLAKQDTSESHSTRKSLTDNSFTQAFSRNDTQKAARLESITSSNQRVINIYQSIGFLAFLVHLLMDTIPKLKSEEFDYTDTDTWQHLFLTCIPPVVYLAAVDAMHQVQKPLSEGAKLNAKKIELLDLKGNSFITSLKIIIVLTAACQLSSIYQNQILWFMVFIVSSCILR